MRRTDRLFELVQLFRGGRTWRGRDLAERLGVSLRTLYRDMDTLIASGIPIEGARGVGYMLRAPIFLPPLTLSEIELEALHLGTELVRRGADPDLADAAERLREKIDAVLPDGRARRPMEGIAIYLPVVPADLGALPVLRRAIRGREVLEVRYTRLDGIETHRRIRPLHLQYWGRAWTCTAWCELRDDFRVFRADRMAPLQATGETFTVMPGQSYADFLAQFDGCDMPSGRT